MKEKTTSNTALASRAFLIWLVIIAAESVHGTLRVLFLEPVVGDFRARQIATVVAMLIIFGITYATVTKLRTEDTPKLLAVGFFWVILSLAFEFSLGRLLGMPWERILSDYNIVKGRLMPLGLIFMFLSPFLALRLRNRRN